MATTDDGRYNEIKFSYDRIPTENKAPEKTADSESENEEDNEVYIPPKELKLPPDIKPVSYINH